MRHWEDKPAIVWNQQHVSYKSLLNKVSCWKQQLESYGVQTGQVVAVLGDYSPNTVGLLLALIDYAAIVVPLDAAEVLRKQFMDIAEVGVICTFDGVDHWQVEVRNVVVENPLTRSLIELNEPGLVLFSSGSTGQPKAALHNMTRFLTKFRSPRAALRTVALPPMDHVAGLDTLFYTLSSGGMVVCLSERTPNAVCQDIQRYKAELLPASATFLNLLLVSEAYRRFDLSSLRIIAYGSEVLPQHTLTRLQEVFPQCKLINKYGTTEFGSPRTRSRADGSLWIKIDSEGFETRVMDGVLWIRTPLAMMGYLNAPNPFDADGWINTEDMVEADGDHIRILGRRTEIINVGGQKVYPAEVENILVQMDNIRDATVSREKNRLMGSIVAARVTLVEPEDLSSLKKRIRTFCKGKLAPYKIPVRVEITEQQQFGARYKKARLVQAGEHRDGRDHAEIEDSHRSSTKGKVRP